MANRLASATSPYLLQHAQNPVDWWEWGPEAFAEAKRRDAPILLSVGYAACHWCHVMAHESFEDEEVAAVLGDGFVAVKVDREERSDVDAIYMGATQALSGSGGWPMTCVLTPDGRPFHAGTYYPRVRFLELLAAASAAWHGNRAEVEGFADRLTGALREHLGVDGGDGAGDEVAAGEVAAGAGGAAAAGAAHDGGAAHVGGAAHDAGALPLTDADLRDAVALLARDFDTTHPGFGTAPKFPPSAGLLHLLRHHERTGEPWAIEMAAGIGEAMARGGIHDQLAGGFARYSVDRAWIVPHFEKMLYDNAQLLRAYAHLAVAVRGRDASSSALFERAARGIVGFLRRDLRTGQGAFASALDADTPVAGGGAGVEGATYVWTPDEVREVLGAADGDLAAEILDVHAPGTFEHGTSVLRLQRDVAEVIEGRTGAPDAAVADPSGWFEEVQARLLAARDRRAQPARDDKVVTAWNGLAVAALAEAGTLLGEADWVAEAEDVARFLLDSHRVNGRWRRASIDGVAGAADAVTEDLGDLAEGLVALHRATGDRAWLDEARDVLDVALRAYAVDEGRPGEGGFYDVPPVPADGVPLLLRPRSLVDLAEPCGTSALAGALLGAATALDEVAMGEVAMGEGAVAVAASDEGAGSAATSGEPAGCDGAASDQPAGCDGAASGEAGDPDRSAQAARFRAAGEAALRLLAGASLAQPRFAGWALATAEAEALRRRRELEGPTATS